MQKEQMIPSIPYDIYESPQEIVVVMPLGGVRKESLEIKIKDYRLVISWLRKKLELKDNCVPLKENCYRWVIKETIDLPSQIYFDKIHSRLTASNILEIIIPKSIVPEKISVEVEYD